MENNETYFHDSTVIAVFNNEQLKKELENWAKSNDVKIYWTEPNSPDVISVPAFALIVDRDLLGKEAYFSYLEYAKEAKDTDLFVAFDNNNELELPANEVVLHVNPENKNAVSWVISNVENAKKLI